MNTMVDPMQMDKANPAVPVPAGFDPALSPSGYTDQYARSLSSREAFFREAGHRVQWMEAPDHVGSWSFESPVSIEWYRDGVMNVTESCLDRHAEATPDRTAIIFEGDEPGEGRSITYADLLTEVCRFANVLKANGAKKGDRITLYMPMIPEAAVAMLACARIGAIHSVVFGGFSPDALAGRIVDCDSHLVITADEGVRGGRKVPLKANADAACEIAASRGCEVQRQIVVRRTGEGHAYADGGWTAGRDVWLHEAEADVSDICAPEPMASEDPLFILYTSGSTGKPKGVLHTCGGYLVWASLTHETVFDLKPDDVYWCTADVGWVTGHTYIVYGPLANGATTVMFEGTPTYPDASRCWDVVDRYGITLFYTAPTAIRALMRDGDDPVTKTDRSTLRVLGTVGEPINPEAWDWYFNVVGEGRCPIVDTWWQTETGGAMIVPLPGTTPMKPGAATYPMFGIEPQLLDGEGHVLASVTPGQSFDASIEGNLVISASWPGQMRTVYGDHARFEQTYFSTFPGHYFTGDGARLDEDGMLWITGRVDDVINVSGHRMGTAEVEAALGSHPDVVESAVVGYPHDIKGQGIYAYVITTPDAEESDALKADLVKHVRAEIGPIASPDLIQFAPTTHGGLPKTRSGKIMRRILRKIAANEHDKLGDTSTLAEPQVVDLLIEGRMNR